MNNTVLLLLLLLLYYYFHYYYHHHHQFLCFYFLGYSYCSSSSQAIWRWSASVHIDKLQRRYHVPLSLPLSLTSHSPPHTHTSRFPPSTVLHSRFSFLSLHSTATEPPSPSPSPAFFPSLLRTVCLWMLQSRYCLTLEAAMGCVCIVSGASQVEAKWQNSVNATALQQARDAWKLEHNTVDPEWSAVQGVFVSEYV